MTENIFTQTHTVSGMHLDRHGRLKPSALLFFAQSAAEAHCTDLSLDWDTLDKQNLFWAVVRHKVQITRLPTLGETVTVKTWPMPTTRSAFPRATAGYDEKGNELFRCISLWILMDKNTRSMVLPGKSGVHLDGLLTGSELSVPSSLMPRPMEHTAHRQVGYTELDRNGHMNNTRYLDWVCDLLPSAFHKNHPAREFTVCYLSEAKETEEVHLHWQLWDGPCLTVEGVRQEDKNDAKPERVFAVQVQF